MAPHEPGHLMGLVSLEYLDGDPGGKNPLDKVSHNRDEMVMINGINTPVNHIMDAAVRADLAMDGEHPRAKALTFFAPSFVPLGTRCR